MPSGGRVFLLERIGEGNHAVGVVGSVEHDSGMLVYDLHPAWNRGCRDRLPHRFSVQLAPDPRWGMQAPFWKTTTIATPQGRILTVDIARTVGLTEPDPGANVRHATEGRVDVKCVLSNSFGFGGNNTALVLERAS